MENALHVRSFSLKLLGSDQPAAGSANRTLHGRFDLRTLLWIASLRLGLAVAAGGPAGLRSRPWKVFSPTQESIQNEWRRRKIQAGGGGRRRGREERPDHPVHPGTDSTGPQYRVIIDTARVVWRDTQSVEDSSDCVL